MGRDRLVRRVILLILLMFTSGLIVGPLRAYELMVSPARLEMQIQPGKVVEGAFEVRGSFDQPTRIRVNIGDWGLSPNGEIKLLPLGQYARSLASWLSVAPAEFLLSQGRTQTVHYRLKPPADITGGYWGVLYFQNVPQMVEASKGTVGVVTVGRVATVIYAATERGAVRAGRITAVTAAWSGGELTMKAIFENPGNLMLRLKGRFEIKDPVANKVLAKVPFEDLPVLPGGTREVAAEWQGELVPGNYLVLALIDFGGANVVGGQSRVFKVTK